jgi:hypothetical protein
MPQELNVHALTRAGLVPYISSWSGEGASRTPVVAKGRWGIGYRRERPGDRDAHGVLWARYVRAPGQGVPQFSRVHPHRQRRAMRQLLCQVCGGPASRNERGVLWLLGEDDWSGDDPTGQPPICLRCAGPASRACPHLRRRTLALRVRQAPVVAAYGTFYGLGRSGPICIGPAAIAYNDPRISRLHARQLMRALNEWTVVDLNEELSAAV